MEISDEETCQNKKPSFRTPGCWSTSWMVLGTLGDWSKKHIWKPISRENFRISGVFFVGMESTRGWTKPTRWASNRLVSGVVSWCVWTLRTSWKLSLMTDPRSLRTQIFGKSIDWCLLSFNRHIQKKGLEVERYSLRLNPFGIQRILWSFGMMVDESTDSFWHKIHGGTTGRLFGVQKRTLQEIVAVDSKCLDSLEEAYRQGPFHMERE